MDLATYHLTTHLWNWASGELNGCELGAFRSHCFLLLLLRLMFNKHSQIKKTKPNTRLSKDQYEPNPNPNLHRRYCSIVRSLDHLFTVTHLDLAWTYSELSKYVWFRSIAHMEAAEHVLRYLHDTWDESITYTCRSRKPNELCGWVDANWASDTDTCCPHTGYIIMMNGGPISWKRRRQDIVTSLGLLPKPKSLLQAKPVKRLFIFVKLSRFRLQTNHRTWNLWRQSGMCCHEWKLSAPQIFAPHRHPLLFCVPVSHRWFFKLIPFRTRKFATDASPRAYPRPLSSAIAVSWWAKNTFCFAVFALWILALNLFSI